MTFAAVGSGYSIDANASSITFSPNPVSTGDLFVATVIVENNTAYATGITGSNITWVQAGVKFLGTTTAFYAVTFLGTATATGAATNTVVFSGTPNAIRGFAQEFSSTVGSWAVDGAQGNVDADTANCPSLTPAKPGDLYWCFARNATGGSGGSTSGYTFFDDASGNWGCYNPACSSSAQAPAFGTADTIIGIAILVKETPSVAPGFIQAATPARARITLPRRGICRTTPPRYSLPGKPGAGPVFRQVTRPVRACIPQISPRGRVYSTSVPAPPKNPGTGPRFIQAARPVQARIPQVSPRGRVYSSPAPAALVPPAAAAPYLALRAPVRTRVSLPVAGRIRSNRGGPVRNPGSGPVFRQLTHPARSNVPVTFSKGRAYSNPGSPPAHLPTPGTPPFNIRVWPGNPGPYYSLYGSGTYTLGTQFSVTVNCTLQNIWWFSPPQATSLPSVCGLWDADTQSAITEDADPLWLDPDGNIALPGDGWVYCAFTAAQVLVVPGVHYVVAVYQYGTNWWVTVPGYWTAGSGLPGQNGITNSPLTAPDTGNSVNGQGCYDTSGTWAFPGTNPGNGEVFYADAELSLLPALGQANPVRARLPLPRRGTCQTFRPPPAAAPHPQAGPVFRPATTPVRARITLPPRGRVISDRGAPVPPRQ